VLQTNLKAAVKNKAQRTRYKISHQREAADDAPRSAKGTMRHHDERPEKLRALAGKRTGPTPQNKPNKKNLNLEEESDGGLKGKG